MKDLVSYLKFIEAKHKVSRRYSGAYPFTRKKRRANGTRIRAVAKRGSR